MMAIVLLAGTACSESATDTEDSATDAEDSATDSAVPTSVAPPPPGDGVPFGSASVTAGSGAVDLSMHGYVEEEFIVSGTANVYHYGTDGAVEVDEARVPYATRILVRRPNSPPEFSGNVHVETSHPQYGVNVVWAQTFEYIVANGDAYVSIATRRTSDGSSAIETMEGFDPVRYEPLDFAEDGLTWDIVSQVGRLLRSETPDNPLGDLAVERLYASGWSGGGALLLLYISDGFHERSRLSDGSPIFDGYLVGEPSGYPRINSAVSAIATNDERQQVQPRDVPAITLHTRPQEDHRRRADSDDPGDRYRVYEVAGAAHADVRIIGEVGCLYEINRFPMHHYFKSTLERLDAWATGDTTPPPSLRLDLAADGSMELDEHGNPRGGVRSSYTDVPTARYFGENTAPPGGSSVCESFGGQESFSPEELAALYPTHDDYVEAVTESADAAVDAGFLLPADRDEVVAEAEVANVPG